MIAKSQCPPFLLVLFLLTACNNVVTFTNALAPPTEYRYFAYGSNMAPHTLEALRSVYPLDSTAAILPRYKLRFNMPGIPGLEPSFASVEFTKDKSSAVHGVLYTLSPQDFARVGSTEGVPFSYKWQRCQVHPYVGNCKEAGADTVAANNAPTVSAWTLVSTFPQNEDFPPSHAYLDLMIQAAKEWDFDKSYVEELKATTEAKTLGKGVAGDVLKLAKWWQRLKRR